MNENIQYLLIAMMYFAVFLIAGIVLDGKHGSLVRLPVMGGIMATAFYFWYACVRR
jgi:hypothetical protein